MKADKIYINSTIWTCDERIPLAEAIAVKGDKIMAAGNNSDILQLQNKESIIVDLEGRFMCPGFIDSHVHLLEGGFSLSSLQLKNASTKEEFIKRIREYASKCTSGEWILAGNWDNTNWGGEMPSRDWIDKFTEEIPVFISRSDLHTALANAAALKIAGIGPEVIEPEGGEIGRFPDGSLNGIFRDNAMQLISRHIPAPSIKQKRIALEAAMGYLASMGVTTVHHMGSGEDYCFFRKMRDSGYLRTRIYSSMPLWEYEEIIRLKSETNTDDKWLELNGAKLFADGSLGSGTAAFTEPYADAINGRGVLIDDPDKMMQGIIAADKAGLQVMVHAIGDRANHIILDCYEKAIKINGIRDRRFRIEHAQHLLPEDIGRFGKSGIIPSMQPWHLMDDGRWAERSIGSERSKYAYCFRSLIDSGSVLAFGSDWLVAPANPLHGIYAAVTRNTLDGKYPDGWNTTEKIRVEEAIKAYTINAAYASFDDKIKGSLSVGKIADMVVLDRNILHIPPEEIREAKVLMTILGGDTVYSITQ